MRAIQAWVSRWSGDNPETAKRLANAVIVVISVVVIVVCYGLLLLLDEWLPARLIPWIPYERL